MLVMRFIMVKSGLSNVSFRLENECPITAFTLRFRTTKANQFAMHSSKRFHVLPNHENFTHEYRNFHLWFFRMIAESIGQRGEN